MVIMSRLRLLSCLQLSFSRHIFSDFTRMSTTVPYIGHLGNVALTAAVCLGLYARWMHSEDIAVILIAFLGLMVFTSSCALVHYFSMKNIGYCLASLWTGCLIGVVAFTTEHSLVEHESVKVIVEVMDVLFVLSAFFRCIWAFIGRFVIQDFAAEKSSINIMDSMEMVGMAIASLVTGHDFVSIALMLAALSVITVTLRLKSFLGFLNLIAYIVIISFVFFPKVLDVSANPFALWCFLARMTFEPFIDIFLSPLSILERWQPLTSKAPTKRRLLIVGVILVQIAFVVTCASQIHNHKEWLLVVPLFGVFSVVWGLFHLVFAIVIWQLSNKITECNTTFSTFSGNDSNMTRMLEAKGIRHFALISQRLAFATMVTTVVIGGLHWTTKTGPSLALWLINLPLEIAVVSLLWELGSILGGTCVGYALLTSSTYSFNRSKKSKEQVVSLLPPDTVQLQSLRANRILASVQQFFTHNLIDVHGCDYSPEGLSLDALEAKFKDFLGKCTADGHRYDTYVLFFSGYVNENGDWTLPGGEHLCFQHILEWWQQSDVYRDTRLILVLDTEFSFKWIKNVVHMRSHFMAIQGLMVLKAGDPEDYLDLRPGDFTEEWMDFNSVNKLGVIWKDRKRLLRPVFGMSRPFPNFTFHLPNDDDITRYWDANFPKVTRPLLKVMNFPQVTRLLCVCFCVSSCLRRWKIIFLAPRSFDTGHGFKLVR